MRNAAAFRQWLHHDRTCAINAGNEDRPDPTTPVCNCGLDDMLAALDADASRHNELLADKTKLEEAMSVMVAAQHKLERQIVKTRAAIQRALDYLNGKDD